jgi:ApaG protein
MTQFSAQISVQVQFLEEQSNAEQGQFHFAYTLNIKNEGEVTFQLIAREWVITDSDGKVNQIKGLGVVGQQPLLKPGQAFEYTSWATIPTPVGTMRGTYYCISEDAQMFEVPIPEFSLTMPRILH